MKFPADFPAAKQELVRFCAAQKGPASLLDSADEFVAARKRLPERFEPFMVIKEASGPDIYAFDFASEPPAVVVWSDHAVVERWDSFAGFLDWMRNSLTQDSL